MQTRRGVVGDILKVATFGRVPDRVGVGDVGGGSFAKVR